MRGVAEQSSSAGLLLSDVLHLRGGAPPAAVMFGCETRETGEIFNQAADGILGLGDHPVSLVNQVRLRPPRAISLSTIPLPLSRGLCALCWQWDPKVHRGQPEAWVLQTEPPGAVGAVRA